MSNNICININDPRLSRVYSPTANTIGLDYLSVWHKLLLLDGEPFTGHLHKTDPNDPTKILWEAEYKWGIHRGFECTWYGGDRNRPEYFFHIVDIGTHSHDLFCTIHYYYAEWYPNGQLKKEANYSEGEIDKDSAYCFDEDGNILFMPLEEMGFPQGELTSTITNSINWGEKRNADGSMCLYNEFCYDELCPYLNTIPTKTQGQTINFFEREKIQWRYSPRAGAFLAIVDNEPFSGMECSYFDGVNATRKRWSQEFFWGESWGEYKEWSKTGDLIRKGSCYFTEWHGELVHYRHTGEVLKKQEFYMGYKWEQIKYYEGGAVSEHMKIVPTEGRKGNEITTYWSKDGTLIRQTVVELDIAAALYQRENPLYNFARELNSDGTFSHLLKYKF